MKELKTLPKPTIQDFEKRNQLAANSDAYFEMISSYDWSTVAYENEGKYGLKTCVGTILCNAIYDDFITISNSELNIGDKIVATVNDKNGIILLDGIGTWLIEPEYDYIGYPNNITIMKKDDKWGVYNLKEKSFIIPLICDWVSNENGFLFCNEIGFYGVANKTGVILSNGEFTKAIFDEVDLEDSGVVKVRYQNEWGYINEAGNFTNNEDDAYYIGEAM